MSTPISAVMPTAITTSSSVNPRSGLIGGWDVPEGRRECPAGCCRGSGPLKMPCPAAGERRDLAGRNGRNARSSWSTWHARGAGERGAWRPVPVGALAHGEDVVDDVDALGALAFLPADGEVHLADALLDLLEQLLHLRLGQAGERAEGLEAGGGGRPGGSAPRLGPPALVSVLASWDRPPEPLEPARLDRAPPTPPSRPPPSSAASPETPSFPGGRLNSVSSSLSGETSVVRGARISGRPGVGLPALGAEVAGDLAVVGVEALVVELLLDVGHLRPGEHGGDGEALGVGVAGHRAGVEVEDGQQREAEDGQGHHHLEQGEACAAS